MIMCTSDFYKNVIAVTNRSLCSRPFPEQIERICNCHPKAIILREKDLPEEEYFLLAEKVLKICHQYQVPCILHTYINVAEKLEQPSVHLPLFLLKEYQNRQEKLVYKKNKEGQKELEQKIKLKRKETQQIQKGVHIFSETGCSVHSVEEALEAQRLGATYLTAGHIYTTDCKKGLPPRGLDFLRSVCKAVSIPVYAIGGIHPGTKQLSEVMNYGAAGGCIMSDMMKI